MFSFGLKIDFSLELASHLSAEGLLDREHYFDWLLGALEHSDLDTLSVYLLIARTHLIELGMSRRFSYKLAASLLEQLHKVRLSFFRWKVYLTHIADTISLFARSLRCGGEWYREHHQDTCSLQPYIIPATTVVAQVRIYPTKEGANR